MVDEVDLLCDDISRAMYELMVNEVYCCGSINGPWMDGDRWQLFLLSTALCGDISQSYSRWMESIAG